MTEAQIVVIVLLVCMVILFLSGRLSVDLTAFLGLLVLVLSETVTIDQAFSGFSAPTVIVMFSTFFLAAALQHTGSTMHLARVIHHHTGNNLALNILAVVLLAVCTSAFMNNIAATAILLPAVSSLAQLSGISPSRLMMPLAFGTLLGGMTTGIGTPPNLLANEVLREGGFMPFGFFDFTLIGLATVSAGGLYLMWAARALLSERTPIPRTKHEQNLASLYRLHERIFSARVPKMSRLSGRSLRECDFSGVLGVRVLAIERGRERFVLPGPEQILQGDDLLFLGGRVEEFERILWLSGARIEAAGSMFSQLFGGGIQNAIVRVGGGSVPGKTLRELDFHKGTGLLVVGVSRDGRVLLHDLSGLKLQLGDGLHVIGPQSDIYRLQDESKFNVTFISPEYDRFWQENLFLISPRFDSPIFGRRMREAGLGSLAGVTVVGILRKGALRVAPIGDEEILQDDSFLVAGENERLKNLSELGELQLIEGPVRLQLEHEENGLSEAVLSPRSRLIGKSLKELSFRERYGLSVLAVWKDGHPVRAHFESESLAFGNALLLYGSKTKLSLLADDPDFILTRGISTIMIASHKAKWVLLAVALMVGLSGFGLLPAHVAAFLAAVLVVISGAISMEQAYAQMEWRVLFMVAALLPMGAAVQNSGLAATCAGWLSGSLGQHGPYLMLFAFSMLSCLVSQILDGAVAVLILGPLALQAGKDLAVSPYPLVMGVALFASLAFLTPFSHKANLLVMAPGGYVVRDFLRVGAGLTLITALVVFLLIPWVFPF